MVLFPNHEAVDNSCVATTGGGALGHDLHVCSEALRSIYMMAIGVGNDRSAVARMFMQLYIAFA